MSQLSKLKEAIESLDKAETALGEAGKTFGDWRSEYHIIDELYQTAGRMKAKVETILSRAETEARKDWSK